ncbi:MAG: acylphosphatase [Ignavibacteriaceae bacterium]
MERAEIIVNGLVQGVGFRYFVYRNAMRLGLKGYVKNRYTGEVLTAVEGEKWAIDELYKIIKTGPQYSSVKKSNITWVSYNNEFSIFEIR